VGILTKDGKKSRARRILLDAMHIIKSQLAKGGQGQEQQQQRRDAA
jgi:ribosomal protein S7